MRGRHSLRWIAPLAALALFGAACGDDGGGAPPTGGPDITDAPTGDASEPETTEPTAPETSESTAPTEPAGGDDVLVVGSLEQPGHIDPARVYEKFASDILFNTTNRLVEFAPGASEVGPGLAESWDISDDGLTYTFHLREGVKFHDGSDFDSEDVKFSLERSLAINHPNGASFLIAGIESVEATDPTTVTITLSAPNVTFLSRLNYTVASILPSDSDAYTVPEALGTEAPVEDYDALLNDATIVGTGAYQLTDYSPGESVTLERFDDYWGDAAKIKTVRIQFFEGSAQLTAALEEGEIDLNNNELGPAERTSLEGNSDVVVSGGPGARIRYLVLDPSQAPVDDPAIRRTIAATIDRQRIIDEVFEGAGTPLFSMVPSGFEGIQTDHISDIAPEYEGDPIDLEIHYATNKYGETEADMVENVARALTESGLFNATAVPHDWPSDLSENLNTGVYSVYALGWYPDYIDADDYIEPFYDSENSFIGFYSNPDMDALIDQEQQETDPAARPAIFDQIQELAATDMPYIPLYEEKPFAYYRAGLTGVEDTQDAAQQMRWFVIGRE